VVTATFPLGTVEQHRMYLQSKIKKPFLYALVGSVLLGTLLGISFVIRNTWSWFEVRVILTTIVVAVASLCGLACDLARLPRGSNWLPKLGVVLSGLAGAMLLGSLWLGPNSVVYLKVMACISILTVATVHLSLLSIAKLGNRFQWVYVLGSQIIAGFALLLCSFLVFEIDAGGVWQLIAALSIVVTAFTLVIPLLHRVSKMDAVGDESFLSPVEQQNLASIDAEIGRLQARISELEAIRTKLSGGTDLK